MRYGGYRLGVPNSTSVNWFQAARPPLSPLDKRETSFLQALRKPSISVSVVFRPEAQAHRPGGERRRHPHGREHVRGRDLAGRAGRARRDRDPGQIEGDQGGFGLLARNREQGGIGQPLGRRRRKSPFRAAIARNPASSRSRSAAIRPASAARRLRAASRAAAPKPAMRGDVLGAGAAAALLPAALEQRVGDMQALGAFTSAPTPFGPPILCAEIVRRSAPSALMSQGIRPAAWTASTCSRPPAAWTSSAAAATGWSTPVSLLACMIETSAGPRPGSPSRRSQIGQDRRRRRPLRRSPRRRSPGKPAAAAHRRMLDRRRPAAGRAAPCRPGRSIAGVSASAFASVPPDVKMTLRGVRADQRRDLLARVLDQTPGRPALGMHRRRIAEPRRAPPAWRRAPPAAAARSRSSRDRRVRHGP